MNLEQQESIIYTQGWQTTIKGKKVVILQDNKGYFNYFTSRTMKQFAFLGRYPSGVSNELGGIKEVQVIGQAGLLIL